MTEAKKPYVALLGFDHDQMNLPGERLDLLLEKEGIPFEYFDRLIEPLTDCVPCP
jgi:hypothetical protein